MLRESGLLIFLDSTIRGTNGLSTNTIESRRRFTSCLNFPHSVRKKRKGNERSKPKDAGWMSSKPTLPGLKSQHRAQRCEMSKRQQPTLTTSALRLDDCLPLFCLYSIVPYSTVQMHSNKYQYIKKTAPPLLQPLNHARAQPKSWPVSFLACSSPWPQRLASPTAAPVCSIVHKVPLPLPC
jgi:hypothetical protein